MALVRPTTPSTQADEADLNWQTSMQVYEEYEAALEAKNISIELCVKVFAHLKCPLQKFDLNNEMLRRLSDKYCPSKRGTTITWLDFQNHLKSCPKDAEEIQKHLADIFVKSREESRKSNEACRKEIEMFTAIEKQTGTRVVPHIHPIFTGILDSVFTNSTTVPGSVSQFGLLPAPSESATETKSDAHVLQHQLQLRHAVIAYNPVDIK